jgi:hypothetical protein
MIVENIVINGKQVEIHEASFGARRYWAKVDGAALFQRGRMRARTFATADAAKKAAVEEARA